VGGDSTNVYAGSEAFLKTSNFLFFGSGSAGLGNGDGSFSTPVESASCPAAGVGISAIADLNGDHKSDLAFPNGE
jgi:hypothetical protein